MRTRQSKYGARQTVVDGVKFHSQKEAKRYQELKLLEKAGHVQDITVQPRYALCVTGWCGSEAIEIPIGRYVADFKYIDRRSQAVVIEDVKGFKTPLYKWKKRHVEAQYGIQILET